MTVHTHLSTDTDAGSRGRELGSTCARQIAASWAGYEALFAEGEVPAADVREIGARTIEAVADWAPHLAEEMAGIADGTGFELWQVGALNARTEILARCRPQLMPGECSTSVYLPPDGAAPRTIQTWDWYEHLRDVKLLWQLEPRPGHVVRTFTESGVLGKIGVNNAGLGLHFNLLRHAGDGQGVGVPVHSVARRMLDEATTVEQAVEIARSAPVTASSVMSVVTDHAGRTAAAAIEVSPVGVAVIPADADGFVLHTNHFLDPELAKGERLGVVEPDTYARETELERRRDALRSEDPVVRAAALDHHLEDGAALCCHPLPDLPMSEQWRSLMVLSLDVTGGHLDYHDGSPCTQTPTSWSTF